MAVEVNQLRRGATFIDENQIWKVISYSHNKVGRGGATIRLQVRNMRTGGTREMTFNNGTRVQDIRVESRDVQYLYEDGEFLTFMDMETYEQPQIMRAVFGDDLLYLVENMVITLSSYNGEIIDYELPTNVEHKVVESEASYAGDTANNPTKRVKTETGLELSVPLFVVEGDTVRIKTEDGSYVTRV